MVTKLDMLAADGVPNDACGDQGVLQEIRSHMAGIYQTSTCSPASMAGLSPNELEQQVLAQVREDRTPGRLRDKVVRALRILMFPTTSE